MTREREDCVLGGRRNRSTMTAKSLKCVQDNCLRSAETICSSGKASAKRIMCRMDFSDNPRPNSDSNFLPTAETMPASQAARC
jgi:hypothetical protein